MANKKDWRAEIEQVAQQLRDPFRMRVAVAGVALAVMYFAISGPLHAKIGRSKKDLTQLQSTTKTAEQVLLLRSHMEKVKSRIATGKSNDVITSHLIELVRSEPVDLMRIDVEPPSRLGPLQSVRVSIDVVGTFESLTALLHRLESDQYLLRMETVAISPPERDLPHPSMQLSLKMLKDPSS